MNLKEDIQRAVEILNDGGIILYPTDTIWGIGCDATNTEAVERIFRLKGRQEAKAMISLVDSIESLSKWVEVIPEIARRELEISERALSIVYDSPKGISEKLLAPDGTSAFRITTLPFTMELCVRLGRPLVSTSANFSGEKSPECFKEISKKLIESVDYVCEHGRNSMPGTGASRILKIDNKNHVTIIRN